ncbi:MAG: hypothetical protein DRN49_07275 [Thaumarchaeota archaeon]|nr:MAG: hypothetical protein DRN49_07275 [Nitrososphaerota archaeon]
MMLIETDILLALVSVEDKHHMEALKLVEKLEGKLVLSPYSLIELDLIIRSGRVLISDIPAFYQAISTFLDYRRIRRIPPKPIYHAEAYRLRQKHGELAYFDSLHAAVSITEKLEHISYDNVYERIKEVNYVHPSRYI